MNEQIFNWVVFDEIKLNALKSLYKDFKNGNPDAKEGFYELCIFMYSQSKH